MNSFFKIENFSSGYPGRFVLNNLSFEIQKGQFVGIIAPTVRAKERFFKVFQVNFRHYLVTLN